MNRQLLKITLRSFAYYRLPVLYQFIVIMLLSAIITGSLLTGSSVRESLKHTNESRIGNSGLLISSGARYFPVSLAGRMAEASGTETVAITELNGWARNFSGGETALHCQVFAVGDDFFNFHEAPVTTLLKKGEAAINRKLAGELNITEGEEIVIRFGRVSDIPSDSPFSDEESSFESLVLVVSQILDDQPADFSLAINQIAPKNIFINRDELNLYFKGIAKANRLLLKHEPLITAEKALALLRQIMLPGDADLILRESKATGQYEFISDRVFIDQELTDEITDATGGAQPVLTYLANSIKSGDRSTPYSFVSALPGELYPGVPDKGGIVINSWLASDLGAKTGDTLCLTYFINGPLNKLIEDSCYFTVARVVDMDMIWGDPALMPEFPGITGSESCSDWETGVPLNMDNIRQKDEDYWYSFKGTPKAFIDYESGKELWGNNFGPATSVRFSPSVSQKVIETGLRGAIDPGRNGFRVTDVYTGAIEAASESVDFSTLFLSLGFFIIISSVVLLSLVLSAHFESRKEHIGIMRAIGFRRALIRKILFLETALVALTGSIAGIFAGMLFNRVVIAALNSVWKGAVQTNTLSSSVDMVSLLSGFIVTLLVTFVVIGIKSGRFTRRQGKRSAEMHPGRAGRYPVILFVLLVLAAMSMISAGIINHRQATALFFGGGTLLFIGSLLLWYLVIMKRGRRSPLPEQGRNYHSWLYYSYYPGRALTPVLFIAAGLFIVITTGSNRKSFSTDIVSRKSGTGGYLLWGETATPLIYDLNSSRGANEYGLNTLDFQDVRFIQGRVESGDDASCLNLNQVKSPPLLGMDVTSFSDSAAFTFVARIKELEGDSPWDALKRDIGDNIIYGIADQTVLQWGLKLQVGDTVTLSSESGIPLHIIIAGGLASSVFQGYILIDDNAFSRYFPSVAGTTLFLVEGKTSMAAEYRDRLLELLRSQGADIGFTWERLAEFNQVSNTYLTVFMTLGGFGMILGVVGLGFILLRNFNLRKREFALLLSTGFPPVRIRKKLFTEHLLILVAGIVSGSAPAIIATLPSISSGADVPLLLLTGMIGAIFTAGLLALLLSARGLVNQNLVTQLRSE